MQFHSYLLAGGLEKKDWHRFVREVIRGSRTRHKETRAFVEALSPHYPEFKITDQDLHKVIFPEKPVEIPRLRVLRTYFKRLLEDFLIQNEILENVEMRDLLLTTALRKRNLLVLSEKVATAAQDRIVNLPYEFDNLQYDLRFEVQLLGIYIRSHRRTGKYNWSNLIGKLETYSLTHRLALMCAMLNDGYVVNEDTGSENQVLRALADAEFAKEGLHPLAQIYYHILKLLGGSDINLHFPKLEGLFMKHGGRISRIERMNIFGFLTNYLYLMDRKGNPKSLSALFRSFKVMHEQNLVFGSGAYSVVMVRNITGVGARMGEVAWTSTFLKEAREKLPSPENENAFQYGSAYLAFTEGNYAEARKSLSRVEYADAFYRLANDNLLLRISYETKDSELFYSVHATLSRHLYRKEAISPRIRKALQSLLKAMLALYELRWGTFGKNSFEEAKNMIESFEDVFNRDWLRAKIAELEQIHS